MKQVCMVAIACMLISGGIFGMDEGKIPLLKAEEQQEKRKQADLPGQEVSLSPHVCEWLCQRVNVSYEEIPTEGTWKQSLRKNLSPDKNWIAHINPDAEEEILLIRNGKKEDKSVILSEHESQVRTTAFSLNSTLLASVSCDDAICIWNLDPRYLLTRLNCGLNVVRAIRFSSDENVLESKVGPKVLKWDLRGLNNLRAQLLNMSQVDKDFINEFYNLHTLKNFDPQIIYNTLCKRFPNFFCKPH